MTTPSSEPPTSRTDAPSVAAKTTAAKTATAATAATGQPVEKMHPMGRLAGRFYQDRRLIVLTVLLAVASGTSSLLVLPRMEDPLLTQRAANVVTIFPGADAERVEALVTEKIEDRLLDIPEIKRMRSQSRAGSSFISIELRDDVYDTEPVWSALRGKLEESLSDLPPGASRPVFDELDISAYAWIGAIVWDRPGTEAMGVLRRLARELKDDFIGVTGTKNVDLFGDPKEEIVVEIDRNRAAAAGLSAAAIAQQLTTADVKNAAGVLRGETELVVEMSNEFSSLEDILDATLQTSTPGKTLRLTDVASVNRMTADPPAALAIIDGKPGIVVSVMLRPEYRIDQWTEAAQTMLGSFQQRLPSGVNLQVIMEQDRYVSDRLRQLAINLLIGVSAVSLVTLIFMGWRSSLLVTATLPVASLMVVSGMRFLGIPIHQMSITGLILALGLLIDNAIIAADEIEISLRRGLSPRQAVGDMVGRLFAPLLASTVTTALAFAPIALMEGPAGEFVGSIAITVMLAIFSSFLLAMTVLPATAALLQRNLNRAEHPESASAEDQTLEDQTLKTQTPEKQTNRADTDGPQTSAAANATTAPEPTAPHQLSFGRATWQHGLSVPLVTQAYRRFLHIMLSHPLLGIGIGLILPISGFLAATQLSEQFFPPADRDQFYLEVELAPQASIEQTAEIAKSIDVILNEHPRVRGTSWFFGESAPPFYYNVIARRKNSPNYGQAIVSLDSNANSLQMIRDLQIELDNRYPSARILVRQLEQGPPFDAPVEVRLFGSNLDQLKSIGEELRTLATTVPDVLHARTALNDVRPVATVDVNAAQAEWAGLSESEIARQLFASLEGLPAGSIIEEVEEIPVRVKVAASAREGIENLGETSMVVSRMAANQPGQENQSAQTGGPMGQGRGADLVPISTIASVNLNPQRALITRYNGRRINEVQSFITAGTLPSKVLAAVDEKIEQAGIRERLPSGYEIEFGGEASERDAAVSRLMANVSVLAVGMVAALVLALASFRLASLIGVVAFLSIGLGLGALWVFGYPFGFMAIIGTMGLIGIAINDSIVVVAALGHNPRVQAGDLSATVDTVLEVTRHVLATTATTIVGFMPLVLSGGGFWPPLAVAIGTGVVGATLISLTLVPCVFLLMSSGRKQ